MHLTITSFLALCVCAKAFTPLSLPTIDSIQANGITNNYDKSMSSRKSLLQMADVASDTKLEESEASSKLTLPIPAMMDEGIFKFNKILIDSVYNIICFFYPVTGGKRDFARFYVLETVARVPYFAYLSVMHLR